MGVRGYESEICDRCKQPWDLFEIYFTGKFFFCPECRKKHPPEIRILGGKPVVIWIPPK